MSNTTANDPLGSRFLPKTGLRDLVRRLQEKGYGVIAPTLRDGVVGLNEIKSASEIPSGLCDRQSPGHYQIVADDPQMCFQYAAGPESAKRYLFPPQQHLFRIGSEAAGFRVEPLTPPAPRLAFLGLRACDLAAIQVQDRVFGFSPSRPAAGIDAFYHETRGQAFFISVDCTRPGGNCFCESLGTGPSAAGGFDLAMTELRSGFIVRAGSDRGRELLEGLPVREPTAAELELVELKLQQARERMGKHLDAAQAREVLQRTTDHARFDEVARRCLSCGNCTMVCPTCFCSTVNDATALANGDSIRTRRWESCFTHQFSFTTPGPVRNSIRGRYRHWLRHKLCTWWEQFGTSGCVGCGRCITWCPVGIDLTEEVAAIARTSGKEPAVAGAVLKEGVL